MKLLSRFVTLRLAADRRADDRRLAQGWRVLIKLAADASGKAAMLVITVVAARRLNADPFGILAYAMATGWLIGVATDAGLSMFLARETARHPGQGRQLLIEMIGLRAGLAFLAATIAVLATPYLVPRHWQLQFVLVMVTQVAAAVIETIAHYFRGLQRSEIESAIHASYRGVMLVLAVAALWWWRRLDYLGVAMLIPTLVALVVSLGIALRLSGDGSRERGPMVLSLSSFVRRALPLGAAALLSALYFRIDVYFIQQWHGFQPVGGYHAAFRLVEALRLLPAAVMAVTFPLMVHATDTALVRRLGGGLTAAGAALAIVCALGAPWIVPLLYGATYAYAAPAFAVLALALPLFFLNYALTHQVIGWDGHRHYLIIAAAALAANAVANLLLVPTYALVGAAMATLVTEIVVTTGCLLALPRLRREPSWGTFAKNLREEPS